MAHTDSCKIQVIQFTKKLVNNGMSIREACQVTEKESDGIPAETVRRWWKATTEAEADKQWVNNDPPTETPEITDTLGGGGGGLFPAETAPEISTPPADPPVESPKTTAELVTEVIAAVDKGTSIREATRKVAEEHGKKPTTLRRAYQKKMAPSEPPVEEKTPVTEEPQAEKKSKQRECTEAMQFATIAISQLERISKDDPNKEKAFDKVNTWMEQNR